MKYAIIGSGKIGTVIFREKGRVSSALFDVRVRAALGTPGSGPLCNG